MSSIEWTDISSPVEVQNGREMYAVNDLEANGVNVSMLVIVQDNGEVTWSMDEYLPPDEFDQIEGGTSATVAEAKAAAEAAFDAYRV